MSSHHATNLAESFFLFFRIRFYGRAITTGLIQSHQLTLAQQAGSEVTKPPWLNTAADRFVRSQITDTDSAVNSADVKKDQYSSSPRQLL